MQSAIDPVTEVQERFARAIFNGFESYFAEFQNITLAARSRFERADWLGMHQASTERIDLYKKKTGEITRYVELIAGIHQTDYPFWRAVKGFYASLIEGHSNFEIAETFYNSVYCSVFEHRLIRDEHAFVFSTQGDMPKSDMTRVYRAYPWTGSASTTFEPLLKDYEFAIPYEDLARDLRSIEDHAMQFLGPRFALQPGETEVQVLEHHFFRNKCAYIVGRFVSGDDSMPFVIPLLHSEDHKIYVDAILFGSDRVSVIFSFTRTYFMVDASVPSKYVRFLQHLMPAKPISEIYSSMGYNKHGKTYYYRCATRHMQTTTDQFVIAPGIKGMVMCVFTLPSYDFVFKIIKDRFTPPKDMTREQVKAKYRFVKRSDRAGRMADTQEFNQLVLLRGADQGALRGGPFNCS
jgi:isocitrate dehydrogenase kinase/phosphatase